jgi:hypothetical protein
MLRLNLIRGLSQGPITAYQVLCKSAPIQPCGLVQSPNLPTSLHPRLMEHLLGHSPLRLVAKRTPVCKGVWKETLECGHIVHAYLEFLWDEKSHLVTFEPNAKRRRCHECKAALLNDIPHKKEKPLAVSGDGDVPQKTCAYGAVENTSSDSPRDSECRFDTGASWSTATKREARRTHTSELGHKATTAGVPAPAEISKACGKHDPIPQGVLLLSSGVEKSTPASPRKPVQSIRNAGKRRAA